MLDLTGVELLVTDEGHSSARGTNNNVRALFLVGKNLLVGRNGSTTVKDTSSDIGHELGETGKLILDLIGKLSSVTENNDRNLAINRLTTGNQLPSSVSKIAHTSVATQQAQTQPSYPYQTWLDTEHLYRGWPGEYIPVELFFMSVCISHCSDNIAYPQRGVQNRDQRWLGGARASKENPCATRQHFKTRKKPTQQNPPETGGVDTDIRTLLVTICLVAVGFGGGRGGQDLLSGLIVVNEFFFVRSGHFGDQVEIGAVCHTCYL